MSTATNKLPAYFKEYLDERFGKVLTEIQEIKDDVADLKKNVNSSNGKIGKLWLAILLIAVVLLIHLGVSPESILGKLLIF